MEFVDRSVCYFTKPGPENTSKTIKLVEKRVKELGIRDIVVASTYGDTGLKIAEVFKELKDVNIVVVTICSGFTEEGWVMTDERRKELDAKGIKVLKCPHALGDSVGSALTEKFGGKTFEEIVAQTLYRFSQGMKVCVEITLMAADAGMIRVDRDVIAMAGTDRGADTAVVLKPSYSRKFLELKIKEIIAKPL